MAKASVLLTPGGAVLPDGTAGNAAPALQRTKSTAAAPSLHFRELLFDPDTDEMCYWVFRCPVTYQGAVVAKIQWKANAILGDVIWQAAVAAITPADVDTPNEKALAAASSVTTTVNLVEARRLVESSIAIANLDGLAAGDFLALYVGRDADNILDTCLVDAELVEVTLEFDDVGDAEAIHNNVAGEISTIAEKAAPVNADLVIIEDSEAGNIKKRVQVINLPNAAGGDPTAIHDNVAGEIAAIAEKAVPIAADMLVIEDSADGNNKKMVQIGNLPSAGGADFSIWLPDAPPAAAGADDDEFADASGGLPAGWTEFDADGIQTVNESEQGLTLLQATHANDKITGIYKSIPVGDFTIIAKAGLNAIKTNYATAGPILFDDATGDNGLITLSLAYSSAAWSIEIGRFNNRTSFNSTFVALTNAGAPTDAYLRIRRTGVTYSFDVSMDGLGWAQIYTSGALPFVPNEYGLYINNVNTGGDIMGRFGFFRYKNSDVGITGLLEGDRVDMVRH